MEREAYTNGMLNMQFVLEPEVREKVTEISRALEEFCTKYEPASAAWGVTYWQLQEIYTARNALRRFVENDERTLDNIGESARATTLQNMKKWEE